MLLLIISALVAGRLFLAGGGPLQAVASPEVRGAPEPFSAERRAASEDEAARLRDVGGTRIGSFERPEKVPEYDIFDERRDARDGARGAWLMVGARSHDEEAYVLITRHLKAEYADFDAVSVEFVELASPLQYRGGALIFNTLAGVSYMGFVYGPPNNEGYFVEAAE